MHNEIIKSLVAIVNDIENLRIHPIDRAIKDLTEAGVPWKEVKPLADIKDQLLGTQIGLRRYITKLAGTNYYPFDIDLP